MSCLSYAQATHGASTIDVYPTRKFQPLVERDLHAAEETNLCYETDFEGRTRYERHQALRLIYGCVACLRSTPFQQESDIRRRLIRGLQYLACGVELDGSIYGLRSIFFLEEEGLLDDFMDARLRPSITKTAPLFKPESNQLIVRLTMEQNIWLKKLQVGCKLYGREDAADCEVILALRRLHPFLQYFSSLTYDFKL
ncbi:hypothetical protein N7447_010523 [Penicillium robsamsonii]|uniref:uncharacterized protein n=1 Tax=Penicillium robsamsonii TaxID=1792511 RepID=UPI00254862DA|nr:uncharacterized protein N7447_010523 [Penicillium robsamsonii]KAJ5811007.1 hypothetical protein N7447_010523 [Penicillium robsamsonii]